MTTKNAFGYERVDYGLEIKPHIFTIVVIHVFELRSKYGMLLVWFRCTIQIRHRYT